ncbi:MAG: 2-oxoacid:acceptor oxidoreductase family protein [Bacillota bacterium]|nr:2-oxoacid:acceptor oxidoreductase family protein [Bacillota bacterium]
MRTEVVVAGFGGQGVVLMGTVISKAAGLFEDKEVAQSQSYGPASRGGACRTDVIISTEAVDYTKALCPDVMILMSPMAAERYLREARADKTVVIVDSSLVKEGSYPGRLYSVPATDIAEREHGARIVANMVMLGAFSAITGLVTMSSLEQLVPEHVPPRSLEVNLRALRSGYAYGLALVGGAAGGTGESP